MRNQDYILDCTAGRTGHGAGTVVNLDDILNCSQAEQYEKPGLYPRLYAAGSTGHGASAVVNLIDILNCSKKKMHDAYSYPQLQEKIQRRVSQMISSTVSSIQLTRTISSTVSLLQMCQLPNVRLFDLSNDNPSCLNTTGIRQVITGLVKRANETKQVQAKPKGSVWEMHGKIERNKDLVSA